jgi:hypothetical protein
MLEGVGAGNYTHYYSTVEYIKIVKYYGKGMSMVSSIHCTPKREENSKRRLDFPRPE